jgi:hypothetical protein
MYTSTRKKQDIVLTTFIQTADIETGTIGFRQLVGHPNTTNHIDLLEMSTEVGIVIGTEIEKFDVTEIVTMIEEMSDDKAATGKGLPALVRGEHTLLPLVILTIK